MASQRSLIMNKIEDGQTIIPGSQITLIKMIGKGITML